MTKAEAGKLVKRMLGSYPSLNLHDPETYIAAVCTLLCGYPLWAGERAVLDIARSSKFIPTQAELTEKLEDQVRVPRYAAEWEAGARDQLLALAAPPRPPKETLEELRARHGPNWGIRDPTRRREPTAQEARNDLIAQIGQNAFDALPDAGVRSDDWQKIKAPDIAPDKARALAGTEGA